MIKIKKIIGDNLFVIKRSKGLIERANIKAKRIIKSRPNYKLNKSWKN